MRHRLLLCATAATIPAIASANGAMGLGLERWDLNYWYAYVLATLIAEAWLIGRWIGYSWWKSLGLSAIANSVTGLLCGGLGLFAPFLHTPFVGTQSNPNPLADALAILIACALPSAVAEYVVWNRANKPGLTWRVIWVHFAVVPLALVILLIPAHPYRGLESITMYHRRMTLFQIGKEIDAYVQSKGTVPTAGTPEVLERELTPFVRYDYARETAMALYVPDFGRFSTGEDHRHRYEFNRAILGHKANSPEMKAYWVWYLRPPGPAHNGLNVEIDLISGAVRSSMND